MVLFVVQYKISFFIPKAVPGNLIKQLGLGSIDMRIVQIRTFLKMDAEWTS